MARFSAPVLFVIGLLAVAAVGGATFGIAAYLDLDGDSTGSGPATTLPAGTPTTPVLGDNQVDLSGVAEFANLEAIPYGTLPLPLTISTPERGGGAGARIVGVLVDGSPATITWDAGRPFVLGAGSGAVDLRIASLYFSPGAVRLVIPDDEVHTLVPGTYTLTTPVAVQTDDGLSEARDVVTFTATEESAITFRGGAFTDLDPTAARDLVGPGFVQMRGQMIVVEPLLPDPVPTAGLSLFAGEFELTFTPAEGGWNVDGLLEGNVELYEPGEEGPNVSLPGG